MGMSMGIEMAAEEELQRLRQLRDSAKGRGLLEARTAPRPEAARSAVGSRPAKEKRRPFEAVAKPLMAVCLLDSSIIIDVLNRRRGGPAPKSCRFSRHSKALRYALQVR
jgi:hypothetical protein